MRSRLIVIAVCTGIGLLLAAPLTYAHLHYRLGWGELREVFVIPEPDGRARVAVAWELSVGGHESDGERRGGTTWMGWRRDDGWGRPADDLVLPQAEARALAERLRAEGLGERRYRYRALYGVNDPAGTAFIQLGAGPATIAHRIGMLCIVASLLLCLPFRLRRAAAASRP